MLPSSRCRQPRGDASSFGLSLWRRSTRRRLAPSRSSAVAVVAAAVACLWYRLELSNSFVSHAARGLLNGLGVASSARGSQRITRHAEAAEQTAALLEGRASLRLVKEQSRAGFNLREAGARLAEMSFDASTLDDKIRVTMDGHQNLKKVEVAEGALSAAGGNSAALSKAILTALQTAHDKSTEGSKGDVWGLYREQSSLLQAPLGQIGIGNTAEDLWANVTKTEETLRLAEELFLKFDVDGDGYWNLEETRQVQKATEGTDMTDEAFTMLVIAAAPNSGRDLSESDLAQGLSKQQVIELYTDASRQRTLGFVLNVRKDHATVFATDKQEGEAAAER